ncbi:MAG: hypothetical protein HQL27_08780 [Candidatus Omnitrophica bacterium]|nr:hypothetical protein [Candidatus Omnitrophota bacterium]
MLTPDTIVQSPGDPQSLNRYSYCGNNPVNRTDPTGHSWFSKFWSTIVSVVCTAVSIIVPALAPLMYLINTLSSGLSAGLNGAGAGGILGAMGGSLVGGAIGIGTADFISGIGNLGVRMGASALQGAAIGAAGAAISGGNVGRGAMFGGGAGAIGGFFGSQQFKNWQKHGEFMSNRDFSSLNRRLSDMTDSISSDFLGLSNDSHRFEMISGEGHMGQSVDGVAFGKYPDVGSNDKLSWMFGKIRPGVIKQEDNFFISGAMTTGSIKVNTFQVNRIAMQVNNPGTFSLATNCSDFALDTSRFIGLNVPSSLTTFGVTNPSRVAAWLVQPASGQETSLFRNLLPGQN